MKIAFVTVPVPGSAGTIKSCSTHIWVHNVARRLAVNNSIVVYTGRNPGYPKNVEWIDGVEYRRNWIPSLSPRGLRLYRAALKMRGLWRLKRVTFFRSRWYYFVHALRVAISLRRQGCDVVHIIDVSQFAPVFRAISPKTRIVLHMHAEWLATLDRRAIETRLRKVDRVIGCSDFITEQVRRRFPAFAERCATVYDGVDLDLFRPSSSPSTRGRDHILFVGSVGSHKGLHVLLDAFQDVAKKFPRAMLEIVGPESQLPYQWLPTLTDPEVMMKLTRFYDGRGYRKHLEDQIRSLNLQHQVIFSGLLTGAELAERYQNAVLFALPSLCIEAFGMPIAEAMACGIPVVASRVGGIPEVVEDGKTGLLAEPGNPNALARTMLRLLSDSGLRNSMGRAARERASQHFSWERITSDLLWEYRNLAVVPERRSHRAPAAMMIFTAALGSGARRAELLWRFQRKHTKNISQVQESLRGTRS